MYEIKIPRGLWEIGQKIPDWGYFLPHRISKCDDQQTEDSDYKKWINIENV